MYKVDIFKLQLFCKMFQKVNSFIKRIHDGYLYIRESNLNGDAGKPRACPYITKR
jgi:hypothetical protein